MTAQPATCEECGRVHPNRDAAAKCELDHFTRRYLEDPTTCPLCGMKFADENKLRSMRSRSQLVPRMALTGC